MTCQTFAGLSTVNCSDAFELLGQFNNSYVKVPKSCITGTSTVTYTNITQQKLGTAGPMNGLSLVVVEPLATGTYNINVNTTSTPIGFLTVTLGIGSFTITSTASEVNLGFTYLLTSA